MHKVIIDGKPSMAEDGEMLSHILMREQKAVAHLCGGKGTCKKCTVMVNGKPELACQYRIESDITVVLCQDTHIFSETGAVESGRYTENLCFALDIGTTTLAMALVSMDENSIIKVITRANPQRVFGADIITRIEYCRKHSVEQLQNVLIAQINEMIQAFGVLPIQKLYVSGNTTMLHTFLGVDCSNLGVAPYTPAFLESKTVCCSAIGICLTCDAVTLPSIATFVGADIVAGLHYVEKPSANRYNLLVDLGTNAEVVLFSREMALCTAAAAGPCFEGANISCGMSATGGAISAFAIRQDGTVKMKTIDDKPAQGICGTGLVDIVAELVKHETIDETGFMEEEAFSLTECVYLSGKDIRQLQLAKSAVYSAILALLQKADVSFDHVEKMYISGGFSAQINIANAVRIGLLPAQLQSRCAVVNNSSLLGTVKFACQQEKLPEFLRCANYIDLSSDPVFSDLFVENMMF